MAFDFGEYRETEITIGESGCKVFRLDPVKGGPACYAKLGTGKCADLVDDEHARLRWLQGRLPVPRILAFDRNEEMARLITTELAGLSARALLDAGTIEAADLVDVLADFMRIIHALPVHECPFAMPLADRLVLASQRIAAGLVDEADFDDARRGQTAADVWQELQTMLPVTVDPVVTHGDFSLDNMLIADGQLSGCIDVGLFGVADRHQDLGILHADLGQYGEHLQARLLQRYGAARISARKLHFHALLNELF